MPASRNLLAVVAAVALLPLAGAAPKTCDLCAKWNTPQEPFRIYGNTWYVGPKGLSSVLVTADSGHVLIDGALPESAPLIARNIAALGFDIRDVKLIVNSHPHWDHAGGIAELQRLSGAQVASSPAGAEALASGRNGPLDPQYGTADTFPPVKDVKRLRDGERLEIGSTVMTVHFTPGHTPGGTTWTWRSCEGETCFDMVYADSLTPVSAEGFRFSADAARVEQFRASIAKVGALPCDILVSAHPEFSGLWERLARVPAEGRKAFVDRDGCRSYAQTARARLEKRLQSERESK